MMPFVSPRINLRFGFEADPFETPNQVPIAKHVTRFTIGKCGLTIVCWMVMPPPIMSHSS